MKRHLLFAAALFAGVLGGVNSAFAQEKQVGDTFTYGGVTYKVASENMFINGSFDDGVNGWKTIDYTTDAVLSNFTITQTGGFDDGAYITTNGAGTASDHTIRQSIAVNTGKMYYFTVYTSGKAPDANNFQYNALFKMTNATTENGSAIKQFEWPQGAGNTATEWSQTEYVFNATDPYVGVRMGWNSSSNFDGFALYEITYDNAANAEDYRALNAAISAAEAHKLGFETGEYAPYTNIEALKALATAKAINQEIENDKDVVTEATQALTDAKWSENEAAMNAVYNGDFGLSKANTTSGSDLDVPGWTAAGGFRQVIENGVNGTFPGLESTVANKAVFVWGDQTYQYGETVGYTMPLAAYSIYELTFKHAGWNGGNNNFYVSITDANGNVLPQQTCGKSTAGPQSANCWNTYKIIFATNENVGNVVLHMIPSGNSTFTDITLLKSELAFTDGNAIPNYLPGTYPEVKIARKFNGNWATAIYPFAIESEDAEVATLSSFADGVLDFTTGSSVANQPCLIKANDELVITDVEVVATNEIDATAGDVTFTGKYTETKIDGDLVPSYALYVLSNNELRRVGEAGATIGAFRAYITVPASAYAKERLGISFNGGETTGIEAVEVADKAVCGEIYNLAGQRVAQPTNGIYIVNGKKILFKK